MKQASDARPQTSGLRGPSPDKIRRRTSLVRGHLAVLLTVLALLGFPLLSCGSKPDPNTLVMIIE